MLPLEHLNGCFKTENLFCKVFGDLHIWPPAPQIHTCDGTGKGRDEHIITRQTTTSGKLLSAITLYLFVYSWWEISARVHFRLAYISWSARQHPLTLSPNQSVYRGFESTSMSRSARTTAVTTPLFLHLRLRLSFSWLTHLAISSKTHSEGRRMQVLSWTAILRMKLGNCWSLTKLYNQMSLGVWKLSGRVLRHWGHHYYPIIVQRLFATRSYRSQHSSHRLLLYIG